MGRNRVKGIGGWLIFVIIGYITTLISKTYGMIQYIGMYRSGTVEVISGLDGIGDKFYWVINFGLSAGAILIIMTIFALIFLFQKKKIYPKYAICLIIVSILLMIGSLCLSYYVYKDLDSNILFEPIIDVLVSGVWIGYFLCSERVKYTFVK